jgi:hypothetical protein
MPLLVYKLPTLPEHLDSSPGLFVGFGLLHLEVSMYCIVDHCLFFCPVYFRHCMICFLRFMGSDYRFVIFKDVLDDVCMSMFASALKSNDLYKQYLVLSFSFCLFFIIILDRLVAYSTTYNNITFYHKLTP